MTSDRSHVSIPTMARKLLAYQLRHLDDRIKVHMFKLGMDHCAG